MRERNCSRLSGLSRHILTLSAAFLIVGCGQEEVVVPVTPEAPSAPPPTQAPPTLPSSTNLETEAMASQFVQMAGLAPDEDVVASILRHDAAQWVAQELAKPAFGYESLMRSRVDDSQVQNRHSAQALWEAMITSDAQLRTRMTFALSQIFVVGGKSFDRKYRYGLGTWLDTLDQHAFGNYRDLMQDVTYSPIMGDYLTYSYNRKTDLASGRQPDENYAREILQLFSIGLVELNMDGTPRLDASGQEIETYTNEDIEGLARVFTGLAHPDTQFFNYKRTTDSYHVPLVIYEPEHDTLEKRFLGTTIPADTPGDQSITQALDAIFAHPNVAPFVARQLIQRFTASSPDKDYVYRVAQAFEQGHYESEDGTVFGTGQRGDLAATIAAVLLDETLFDDRREEWEGKVREPVLKFVQLTRTYERPSSTQLVQPESNWYADTTDPLKQLAQGPLQSPSVFNFYRPGYIAPSTESGNAGYTAPELQIVNQASALGFLDFTADFLAQKETDLVGRLVPDLSEELAISHDAQALTKMIDRKLMVGRMNETTRNAIIGAVEALPIRENPAFTEMDQKSRVRIAIYMAIASAEYAALN